ncbi:hypothetical protein EZV77_19460 [Burkholderia thailandensis]|nr:hypothetical protein EZV77_19460 [Burkholderia thailandensis]
MANTDSEQVLLADSVVRGLPPLMTREAWSAAIGLPLEVVRFQCHKGYWPCIRVGKYSLINVEAIRAKALERADEFVLGRNGTR